MVVAINQYILSNPQLLLCLSRLESQMLGNKLSQIKHVAPVYVTGLARSGTSIILECLARQSCFAYHRYADFPFIYTPYVWGRVMDLCVKGRKKKERSHKDGLKVNSFSPESMEEIIWSHFFPEAHALESSSCLNADFHHPEFESLYKDHILKLMLVRGKKRYLAKANYNISRIPYLLSLFPEAKFVIVYRHPEQFIASSMKQDALFCKEQHTHPSKLAHTDAMQHFEFGAHRVPINFGDTTVTKEIDQKISQATIEGWALYWNTAYSYIADLLEQSPKIRKQVKLISYDKLCTSPKESLTELFTFCDVTTQDKAREDLSQMIAYPSYYKKEFSKKEQMFIKNITGGVLVRLDEM